MTYELRVIASLSLVCCLITNQADGAFLPVHREVVGEHQAVAMYSDQALTPLLRESFREPLSRVTAFIIRLTPWRSPKTLYMYRGMTGLPGLMPVTSEQGWEWARSTGLLLAANVPLVARDENENRILAYTVSVAKRAVQGTQWFTTDKRFAQSLPDDFADTYDSHSIPIFSRWSVVIRSRKPEVGAPLFRVDDIDRDQLSTDHSENKMRTALMAELLAKRGHTLDSDHPLSSTPSQEIVDALNEVLHDPLFFKDWRVQRIRSRIRQELSPQAYESLQKLEKKKMIPLEDLLNLNRELVDSIFEVSMYWFKLREGVFTPNYHYGSIRSPSTAFDGKAIFDIHGGLPDIDKVWDRRTRKWYRPDDPRIARDFQNDYQRLRQSLDILLLNPSGQLDFYQDDLEAQKRLLKVLELMSNSKKHISPPDSTKKEYMEGARQAKLSVPEVEGRFYRAMDLTHADFLRTLREGLKTRRTAAGMHFAGNSPVGVWVVQRPGAGRESYIYEFQGSNRWEIGEYAGTGYTRSGTIPVRQILRVWKYDFDQGQYVEVFVNKHPEDKMSWPILWGLRVAQFIYRIFEMATILLFAPLTMAREIYTHQLVARILDLPVIERSFNPLNAYITVYTENRTKAKAFVLADPIINLLLASVFFMFSNSDPALGLAKFFAIVFGLAGTIGSYDDWITFYQLSVGTIQGPWITGRSSFRKRGVKRLERAAISRGFSAGPASIAYWAARDLEMSHEESVRRGRHPWVGVSAERYVLSLVGLLTIANPLWALIPFGLALFQLILIPKPSWRDLMGKSPVQRMVERVPYFLDATAPTLWLLGYMIPLGFWMISVVLPFASVSILAYAASALFLLKYGAGHVRHDLDFFKIAEIEDYVQTQLTRPEVEERFDFHDLPSIDDGGVPWEIHLARMEKQKKYAAAREIAVRTLRKEAVRKFMQPHFPSDRVPETTETVALIQSILHRVQGGTSIRVMVYGSYARSQQDGWSDLDLQIIIPDRLGWKELWVSFYLLRALHRAGYYLEPGVVQKFKPINSKTSVRQYLLLLRWLLVNHFAPHILSQKHVDAYVSFLQASDPDSKIIWIEAPANPTQRRGLSAA